MSNNLVEKLNDISYELKLASKSAENILLLCKNFKFSKLLDCLWTQILELWILFSYEDIDNSTNNSLTASIFNKKFKIVQDPSLKTNYKPETQEDFKPIKEKDQIGLVNTYMNIFKILWNFHI